MITTRRWALLVCVLLGACSSNGPSADPSPGPSVTGSPTVPVVSRYPELVSYTRNCTPPEWSGEPADYAGRIVRQRVVNESLHCADFTGARLTKVRITSREGAAALFRDATLTRVDVVGATLLGADFRDAQLTRVRFIRANLLGAQFDDTTLRRVRFVRSTCPSGVRSDDNAGTCRGQGVG